MLRTSLKDSIESKAQNKLKRRLIATNAPRTPSITFHKTALDITASAVFILLSGFTFQEDIHSKAIALSLASPLLKACINNSNTRNEKNQRVCSVSIPARLASFHESIAV